MPSRDLVCVALLAALFLAVGVPRYLDGVDPGDEGYLAYGAVRVLEGQIPNRDFVTYQPPLGYYSIACLFRWFGVSLHVMRTLGLGFFVAIPVLIYAVARQVAGPLSAFLVAIPFTVFGVSFFSFTPTFVWHATLLALASAFLFSRAMGSGSARLALAAGAAAALTILSRHDQGAYLCVATIGACLLRGAPATARSLFLPWALGLLAILVPLSLWWLAVGAATPMIDQLLVFLGTRYRETSGLPFPKVSQWLPLPTGGRFPGFLFYVPPLIIVAALVEVVSETVVGRPANRKVAFIAILAALFYLQCVSRADPWHLVITLPPTLVLCAWLAERAAAGLRRRRVGWGSGEARWCQRALAALVTVLLGVALVAAHRTFQPDSRRSWMPLRIEHGGVRLSPDLVENYRATTEKIRALAPRERSILVMPYQPLFYMLADRRNPTRWNYLWPGDQTADDYREMLAQLDHDPPALIVLFDRENMADYAGALLGYVEQRYALAEDWGFLGLYIPR